MFSCGESENEGAQAYPILCNPMDYSLPGSSVHGVSQARIPEWVAISFSGDLPDPGIEPGSPALQADSLPSATREYIHLWYLFLKPNISLLKIVHFSFSFLSARSELPCFLL